MSPRSDNIADAVRLATLRNPRADALVTAETAHSWGELAHAMVHGAGVLSSVADRSTATTDGSAAAAAHRGGGRGERVLLALPTGPELAAALFATALSGHIAVPVDPNRTDLGWAANRVQARWIITDVTELKISTSADPVQPKILTSADIRSWWHADPAAAGFDPEFAAHKAAWGDDIVLLARASRPGPPVMLSHRAIIAAANAVSSSLPEALKPTDRVAQVLPLYHVVGLVTAFLPAALAGAAVVIPTDEADRAGATLDAITRHRVTVLPAEPTLYRQLRRAPDFERSLATVRLMTSSSSPLDPVDFAAIRAATGQAVREGYGISEAASAVTSTLMSASPRPGSVGTPYPGVELRIADHRAGDDPDLPDSSDIADLVDIADPDGGLGPIAIRGDVLFSGYWPDGRDGPDEEGWFVTGDIGYSDDAGELHLVDRADETIRVAGFTVYPREVEDALVGHPFIADAAVVGVPGRAGDTVAAVLVAQAGTRPTSADVTEFLSAVLPPFKRPTVYQLVDVLPRTEVGRLDRAAIRASIAQQHDVSEDDVPDRALTLVPLDGEGTSPEQAAPLSELGSRLPSATGPGARRGAHDTDEDLF